MGADNLKGEMDCAKLDDAELIKRIRRLVREEYRHLAELIVHLIEFDRRRLYAELGYRSLYVYCVEALGYSEQSAYRRIIAARIVSRFPASLDLLRLGRLHMTALLMLSPHLTEQNHAQLLIKACGKSKRDLEVLLAPFEPGRKIPDRIWHFATQKPSAESEVPTPPTLPLEAAPQTAPAAGASPSELPTAITPGAVRPDAAPPAAPAAPPAADGPSSTPPSICALPDAVPPALPAPEPEPQVRISFSATEDFFRKLEKARGLLRHKHPSGRLEEVFDEALDDLLDKRDPDRRLAAKRRREESHAADRGHSRGSAASADFGAAATSGEKPDAPAPPESPAGASPGAARRATDDRSRYIPQPVKDKVWERDSGRCTYIAPDGLRCAERQGLEFDHIMPWALGGRSDDASNIRLLCRTHNQHRARKVFGADCRRDLRST